jgi:hypothetical protein
MPNPRNRVNTYEVSYVYGEATPIDAVCHVVTRPTKVVGAIHRPLVVGSDGSAVTAVLKWVASGTAIASGTAMHSTALDLKGTINTNVVVDITETRLEAGSAIGLDVTGTATAARGVVTLLLQAV